MSGLVTKTWLPSGYFPDFSPKWTETAPKLNGASMMRVQNEKQNFKAMPRQGVDRAAQTQVSPSSTD
jgi:hypothetical protein